ncbi:MAG: hypothetical protein LBV57_04140 [Candidatus Symbiothrix sp.]|jgi:uncharacterized protein YndB with AHSA1/START domain|nr:hypothetical protein [Candidatus Symbiothrix sp.]
MKVTREKINIEYIFNQASKASLWNCLSTADGLSEWFADRVFNEDNHFTFNWKGHSLEAELLGITPFVYIRFRWTDEDEATYFEFRLHQAELTNDIMLEITDFAEEGGKDDVVSLWDTQIKTLKRKLGV